MAFAWRHQAITWTNAELLSVKSSDIHLNTIAQEIPQLPITKISMKMTYLKFHLNLPGAKELIQGTAIPGPLCCESTITMDYPPKGPVL